MLLSSSVLASGVKVPVQVMLSELVMVASVPLGSVMSASLEKEATTSEKTSVTVALSPALSSVSESVKGFAEGARVSTSKFGLVSASPGLPTWSVQLSASVIVLLSTSLPVVGVKVPVQVVLCR